MAATTTEQALEGDSCHLYYIPESPFSHKILLARREMGLENVIECHTLPNPPLPEQVETLLIWPLSGFVPTLKGPGGTFYDSSVILQYMDSLVSDLDSKIFPPPETADRLRALAYEALCKGIVGNVMMVQQQRARGVGASVTAPQEKMAMRGLARLTTQYQLPDHSRKVLDVRAIALASLLDYMTKCDWCKGWSGWEAGQLLDEWFEEARPRLKNLI